MASYLFLLLQDMPFIAKELLNSLERLKILSKKRINNFENSLKTITSIFLDDLNKNQNKQTKL